MPWLSLSTRLRHGFDTGAMPDEAPLDAAIAAVESLQPEIRSSEHLQSLRDEYSKLRSAREKATFAMMMRMNPEALTKIRKEFFAREDSVVLDEFIYIIQKHLMSDTQPAEEAGGGGASRSAKQEVSAEHREFLSNMYELFKDIDVNGDGDLEWEEFTTFTVDKANQLNRRLKLASIANYYESSATLDPTAEFRHRNDISRFCNIPTQGLFAMVEDHRESIFLFNSRQGRHIHTIQTDSAPIAMETVPEADVLVTSNADMTLNTYSLADPNPKKRFTKTSTWTSPGVQMAVKYVPDQHKLLYSGATNGNVYSWRIKGRSLVSTFSGHSDIVMSLVGLSKLNNIASGSLDKSIILWDTYTKSQILRLWGHKKGVLDVSYSEQYRLLASCGFEHDVCIWSPFVKNLVYRLKGHNSSLVGVTMIPNTPEILSADILGEFRLWDVRTFQCLQTFSRGSRDSFLSPSATKLGAFFHTALKPRNSMQKENDSRIYCGAKNVFSFDQVRVVHGATTDFTNVHWVAWNAEASVFITVSERNTIVWDALIGSKTITCTNICGAEVSAVCLDDRKRKMIVGSVSGKLAVYNHLSGDFMKSVQDLDIHCAVVGLRYLDALRRFIAGFSNGIINVYDENSMEDCSCVMTFNEYSMHAELTGLCLNPHDDCVVTFGASSHKVKLWDTLSGKCDHDLAVCDHMDNVIHVTFLEPYPLFAVSDSAGNVTIWSSRAAARAAAPICGFVNQTPLGAVEEPRKRTSVGEEEPPRRALAPSDCEELDITPLIPVPMEEEEEEHEGSSSFEAHRSLDESSVASSVDFSGPRQPREGALSQAEAQEQYARALHEARELFRESEATWGKTTSAQTISWDQGSKLLFTGDDLGFVRCFSIKNALLDIGGDRLSGQSGKHMRNHGLCRSLSRNGRCALPPLQENPPPYIVGTRADPLAYRGVDFRWAIMGHEDRIICSVCTPTGVATSGSDMLVKLWSFEGRPLGVLLQSVPTGVRGRGWTLPLDVETMIARENEELDVIIDSVAELAANTSELPDIDALDFAGLEPGSESADFSRSELRQRIEKTSQILGLNFPNEKERADREAEKRAARQSRRTVLEGPARTAPDDASAHSNKSAHDALREARSVSRTHTPAASSGLTREGERQHTLKVRRVQEYFEGKTSAPVRSSSLAMQRRGSEASGRSGGSLRDEGAHTSTAEAAADDPANVDDDLTVDSSLVSSSEDSFNFNSNTYMSKGTNRNGTLSSRASIFKSPVPNSARNEKINSSCKKYKAYDKLTKAMELAGGKQQMMLTTEQREELLRKRLRGTAQALEEEEEEEEIVKTTVLVEVKEELTEEAAATDPNADVVAM